MDDPNKHYLNFDHRKPQNNFTHYHDQIIRKYSSDTLRPIEEAINDAKQVLFALYQMTAYLEEDAGDDVIEYLEKADYYSQTDNIEAIILGLTGIKNFVPDFEIQPYYNLMNSLDPDFTIRGKSWTIDNY